MGISERRELQNRLEVLLAYLLKFNYLTQLRTQNERGWRATIREQRKKVLQCLKENPSIKPNIAEMLKDAYYSAIDQVVAQINIDETLFPSTCPYCLEQVLDNDFYG